MLNNNNSGRRQSPASSSANLIGGHIIDSGGGGGGGGSGSGSSRTKDSSNDPVILPKYKRDLVQKMKILRNELQAMQPQAGHCRLEVSRDEVFEVRLVS